MRISVAHRVNWRHRKGLEHHEAAMLTMFVCGVFPLCFCVFWIGASRRFKKRAVLFDRFP